jgi:S1-C subfamily serine protease
VPLSDQLRTFFGVSEGVLVSEVTTGSPAAEAGLRAGDVITHVGGAVMNSAADVVRAVEEAGAGVSLEIAVVRDSQKLTVRANIPGDRGRQPSRQPVWPV